jgi:hypothetical protein
MNLGGNRARYGGVDEGDYPGQELNPERLVRTKA